MNRDTSLPRILLISQWPNIKNGEYELIEKIKQTGYEIAVVDYFGFRVDTGECINNSRLWRDFDFAISFHYDTPKFLNIPTFLWVANPLEFMHLHGHYRTVLIHHLRANDDYLYNGADLLKVHIRNVVGSEWIDSELGMFASSSRKALIPPKSAEQIAQRDTARKIFYCGVNWEKGTDRSGRAQGLLDILQAKDAADFYGPNKLEGISTWEGFTSYRGEIPFDGVSMNSVMREYGAVLAVSSPAHLKSRTSSSRVFEGFAAGVPVISDENPHVRKLFGDLVYYFRGSDEEAQAHSILDALQEINRNPDDARERVARAQALISDKYCFEFCFEEARAYLLNRQGAEAQRRLGAGRNLDVFLCHHDPDTNANDDDAGGLDNLGHILEAAGVAISQHDIGVTITYCGEHPLETEDLNTPARVTWRHVRPIDLTDREWASLRLGEKVALLRSLATGDHTTFLTQFDFPHYDCLATALRWFYADASARSGGVHIAGFYVDQLNKKATIGTNGIIRNNASTGLYRWTQNSLAEHQMATLMFGRDALGLLTSDQIDRFDVLLPISIIAAATGLGRPVYRSRRILLRARFGHFHRHYDAYRRASERGFWAQHYDLVSNYNHELNALYDIHHESVPAREIADLVSGHALPPAPPIDPAVHSVNQFIGRIRPAYRAYKKIRHALSFK